MNLSKSLTPNMLRYQLVDYLTTTGIYEFIIIGGNPREVPTLKTLRLTFDNVTWAFVITSNFTTALVLFLIDIMWNYVNNCKTSNIKMRKYGHHGM